MEVLFGQIIDGNERILGCIVKPGVRFSFEGGIKYLGIWDEALVELTVS
jgi:hypothetical protein